MGRQGLARTRGLFQGWDSPNPKPRVEGGFWIGSGGLSGGPLGTPRKAWIKWIWDHRLPGVPRGGEFWFSGWMGH